MLHRVLAVAGVGRLRDLRLPWLHGETSSRRLNRRRERKRNHRRYIHWPIHCSWPARKSGIVVRMKYRF